MEWNIQSRAHACQVTERPFEDKERFHTLLFQVKGGYERLDICEQVWEEQYKHGATEKKGFVSHWQTTYKAPPPKEPDPIQKENAESLLRKLVEANEPKYEAARYILAVMLERKRQLKIRDELKGESGERVFIYEFPKSGDSFMIIDPELQMDQLEEVQREVADLLEFGLPTPESENSEAPGDTTNEGETSPEGSEGNDEPTEEFTETEGQECSKGEEMTESGNNSGEKDENRTFENQNDSDNGPQKASAGEPEESTSRTQAPDGASSQ